MQCANTTLLLFLIALFKNAMYNLLRKAYIQHNRKENEGHYA